MLRSLEASLERLGLDRIDIALLHDPDDHAEQALREAYPALERLRAEGVVGAIGVGMNQSALPARFVRETDIDVVLLAGRYTLLDQDGLAELLPAAAARGVSSSSAGCSTPGCWPTPRPGATYDYAPAPQPVLDRALRLQAVCERHGVPLRAAALRFPFGHPAVASVLTGARSPSRCTTPCTSCGARSGCSLGRASRRRAAAAGCPRARRAARGSGNPMRIALFIASSRRPSPRGRRGLVDRLGGGQPHDRSRAPPPRALRLTLIVP